ncbi:E3 ubiquitin-protein ligase TRIM32-like isoform X2 [Thrips palmi]|nr:E3 ubiquitin-protein ligase TRIM32-like isoform X2 [Thrips palmi]XP_034236553.1 E3 ubiquitin-protein ligase TRIM32-like isoform X2 [Thrips palmi]XP_034236554.1 E3 ubiquitin-protein ligase TRIM32-like isoform X2 [Thrips palmi]XP_034236555.1 E3 ubiquitin-protein ligase TRIM32-like isoform X2 [Thrips palmi]XP_034236556.1 E3 ubiquitin-protein ligase TRIM32-like isoform X2 [Thrips palmi]XP_034236557.1 E3 ubiquitin-protein ligase TRIM32-like isoform X2 [Thrips palmi]
MECSVCLEAFDREVRRPKALPCGHSFCLRCLQNPDFGHHCPQDRRAFRNEPIVNLPDNFNVLSMLGDGAARDEAVWCEACDRQFSGDCADAGHRPCSVRRRRALQDQRGPDVQQGLQDLRRELQELRQQYGVPHSLINGQIRLRSTLQVEDQQRGAAPPRLHLDVQEMSVEEGMLKERNDLLLSGRLDQVSFHRD